MLTSIFWNSPSWLIHKLVTTSLVSILWFTPVSKDNIPSSQQPTDLHKAVVGFTIFSNDSIAHIYLPEPTLKEEKSTLANGAQENELNQLTNISTIDSIDFISFMNSLASCQTVLKDTAIYHEGWDTLQQAIFWQTIQQKSNDTCWVSRASTREILTKIPFSTWQRWSDTAKTQFQDSLKLEHGIPLEELLYVTSGKKHYYQFHKAIPTISKGISIFQLMKIDPWYAQTILLIESPGTLRTSPAGAYGSFQLMKGVAKEFGLIVNHQKDERKDFSKSAYAAGKLLTQRCIPQAKYLLNKYQIPYHESDLWFRLLVLHIYHAGIGNVSAVLSAINPSKGGMELIQQMWTTEAKGFKNASQNYSQVALASLINFDKLVEEYSAKNCMDIINTDSDPSAVLALHL